MYRTFFGKFLFKFCSHIKNSKWAENVFLSIVQAVAEVLNKSHFSLQMGDCPIPVAEDSGPSLRFSKDCRFLFWNSILNIILPTGWAVFSVQSWSWSCLFCFRKNCNWLIRETCQFKTLSIFIFPLELSRAYSF